ncbi:MAG: pyridoxal-phosphate dependent enzyme, partial [Proteobacteria bacterium]|nr:pyridoxal-phosphate dependent enzyme [Pseudomonadota bacterium]
MPTSPPSEPESEAPTYDDVVAAAEQIAGHAVTTPLLESPLLNEKLGGRLLVKAECLQRSGAFKFRGAYNRISRLGDEQRKAGVIAFSSGNHAQGVAMVAQMLGVPAVIVMPTDAPDIKLANTRAYGAEVVLTPAAAESNSPEGYSGVAARLANEIPYAWQPNQFANLTNPQFHYEVTGPEIWKQTEGKITAFVGGIGTGGT